MLELTLLCLGQLSSSSGVDLLYRKVCFEYHWLWNL